MIIRNFEVDDLVQVLELSDEVRQHHANLLRGYFKVQANENEVEYFLDALKNEKVLVLVAVEDNVVYGYLRAEFMDKPYLVKSKIADIDNLGVSSKFRRQGIGKKLMDAFVEICREKKIDEIRLSVYNKNISAYNFYEEYGFEPMQQKMVMNLSGE